jgi:hypothetical protein
VAVKKKTKPVANAQKTSQYSKLFVLSHLCPKDDLYNGKMNSMQYHYILLADKHFLKAKCRAGAFSPLRPDFCSSSAIIIEYKK